MDMGGKMGKVAGTRKGESWVRSWAVMALAAACGATALTGLAAQGDGPAYYAGPFQPGLWRITSVPVAIDLPGLDSPEAKEAVQASLAEGRRSPEVDQLCVTAADVAVDLPDLLPDPGKQPGCTGTPSVVGGGRLAASSTCASTALALTGRYDASRLAATMTVDTTENGQTGRVTLAMTGVRTGSCDREAT